MPKKSKKTERPLTDDEFAYKEFIAKKEWEWKNIMVPRYLEEQRIIAEKKKNLK